MRRVLGLLPDESRARASTIEAGATTGREALEVEGEGLVEDEGTGTMSKLGPLGRDDRRRSVAEVLVLARGWPVTPGRIEWVLRFHGATVDEEMRRGQAQRRSDEVRESDMPAVYGAALRAMGFAPSRARR